MKNYFILLMTFFAISCGFNSQLEVEFEQNELIASNQSAVGTNVGNVSAKNNNLCEFRLLNYLNVFKLSKEGELELAKNSPAQGDYKLEIEAKCEDQVPRLVKANIYIAAKAWLTQVGVPTASALGYTNSNAEPCWDMTMDKNDNPYCAGHTFGSFAEPIGGTQDIIVQKLSTEGDLLWASQIGMTTATALGLDVSGIDSCQAIVASENAIYCAGFTTGSLAEPSGGGVDLVIAKFDFDGNVIWIRQLGATSAPAVGANPVSNDYCYAITVDKNENIYCSGRTASALAEPNPSGFDIFVTKINSAGVFQWVSHLGQTTGASISADTSGSDTCFHVTVDSLGNVYCAFQTSGSFLEVNLGSNDVGLVKYDTNGVFQWARHLGATSIATLGGDTSLDDRFLGIDIDKQDNVIACGLTSSSLFTASKGDYDAFIIKYNSSGEIVAQSQFGTAVLDQCEAISVDQQNNIFAVGSTAGALEEPTSSIGDFFIRKLNNDLGTIWTRQGGSVSEDIFGIDHVVGERCVSSAVDSKGNIYCQGLTQGDLKETVGSTDFFMTRIDARGFVL